MSEQLPQDEKKKLVEHFEAIIARTLDEIIQNAGPDYEARAANVHPQYEPMKAAIEAHDDLECARLLEAHPELASTVDEYDELLLVHAIRRNNTAAVKGLCRAGADPNYKSEEGYTPLRDLLEGAAKDVHNAMGDTQAAVMVRLLCSLGANPNGLDRPAESPPLYYAVAWDLPECARALLDAGADVNKPEWEYGSTPIMNCANKPHLVRVFLERGADVQVRDHEGRTALQHLLEDPEPLDELTKEVMAAFDRAFPSPERPPIDPVQVAANRAEIRRILAEFGFPQA